MGVCVGHCGIFYPFVSAMVFQEVELKFRATEDQMKVLEKFLDEEATFVDEVHHEEYYLDKSSDPFVTKNVQGYMDAHQYLRVRFSDGQALVCFKDWHTDDEASKLSDHVVHDYCQEYETQVIDGRVMLEFFKAL